MPDLHSTRSQHAILLFFTFDGDENVMGAQQQHAIYRVDGLFFIGRPRREANNKKKKKKGGFTQEMSEKKEIEREREREREREGPIPSLEARCGYIPFSSRAGKKKETLRDDVHFTSHNWTL